MAGNHFRGAHLAMKSTRLRNSTASMRFFQLCFRMSPLKECFLRQLKEYNISVSPCLNGFTTERFIYMLFRST